MPDKTPEPSFRLSRLALEDLKQIAGHTEKQWGREMRIACLNEFDETFHLLARSPNLGRSCDEIKHGYRKFPKISHLLYYKRIDVDTILIVRILHRRMDAGRHMSHTP